MRLNAFLLMNSPHLEMVLVCFRNNMNNQILSEKEVCEAVKTYFNQNEFNDFTVNTERAIHFGAGKGRNHGIADVVLSDAGGHWIAIVECKSEEIGDTEQGREQLKSYLSATDTRFGILAFSGNPNDWIYCENLRSNVFRVKQKSDFEDHVSDPPTADRKVQAILNRLKQKYRRLKRATIALSALMIIAVIPIGFLILRPTQKNTNYQVIRIIDGDTVEIQYEGQPTSVQLIGVNAPEIVYPDKPPEAYGEEAARFLQDFLLDDSIYLRFEETKRDKYDRLIAYIYRASDGIFVNLEIIREGYGRVDTRYPFKHEETFTSYQSRARAAQKGLWGNFR